MNLRALTAGAIAAINPPVAALLQQSAGYATASDGTQVPTYTTTQIQVQVQALSWKDLQQVDGLNIQGEARAIYVNGPLAGVLRTDQKGGDLLTFADGSTWLVRQVTEQWPDWCKAVIVRQD